MPVLIGTSGWQYRSWRGRFYPKDVPQPEWLEHFCQRFKTVEVNNTFYRLPPPEVFAAWRKRVPEDFVMVLKVSRYLTHLKQLHDPEEPVSRFLAHAAPLGERTGPLLIQLPPRLKADLPRLAHALDQFPESARLAVEFRHESWFTEETRDLLGERGVSMCLADRGDEPVTPLWRTADWGYVRLHWGTAAPESCYDEPILHEWARRIAELWQDDEEVFVFFNNDPNGCAVRDAQRFAAAVESVGRTPTRVPADDETPVAGE